MTTTIPAGWMPIESAPKDGTEVLAWREDCGQFIARYTSADAFPMTQAELDAYDEGTLFAKDWFTQWPQALRLEGSEIPTKWQPLPADPSPTCNNQGAVGNILTAQPCPDCSAPASPVSTVEQGDAQPWPAGLLERVKAAEQRIRDGHGSMRIPADPTDPDLVLAEVAALIEGRNPPFWLRPAPAAPATGDAQTVAALAELVACDRLKKQIASMQACVLETEDDVQELDAMMTDLARRQPAAWDAARAVLAAQRQGDA